MAIEVGYAGKVQVASDTSGTAGTFTVVGGQAEGNITPKANTADITQTNTAGYEQRIPTTLDADLSLSFFYIPSDAGQAIILSSLTNRTPMWFKVYRDATNVSIAYCYATEFPTKIDPKNPVKVDAKLMFNGSPTVSPATPLTIA